MDSNMTGVLSEKRAIVWLLEQGFFVFNNVAPHGPIDMVAIKGSKTLYIDVKTATMVKYKCRDGYYVTPALNYLEDNKKDQRVTFLFVTHSGQVSFNPGDFITKIS